MPKRPSVLRVLALTSGRAYPVASDMETLQPICLLVALKLAALGDEGASIHELEAQLQLPASTLSTSLRRLREHRIVRDLGERRRIQRIGARDLVEHGIRWIAPGEIGDHDVGLFTSHAAEPLASQMVGDPDPLVMPLPDGPHRGRVVCPIHPLAPIAAAKDERLYRLLVIADAFRIGRARDREVARMELRRLL